MRRGLATVLLLGLVASRATANTFVESGDATALPPGQETRGEGSLDTILGTLIGDVNDVDLFAIEIVDPAAFSARVEAMFFDPAVFLFDAAAFGVAANDDINTPLVEINAYLPPGNALYATRPAGRYLLAVTGRAMARSQTLAGLLNIFPLSPQMNIFGLVGPTGPGGGNALADWRLNALPATFDAESYTVTLTGAEFAPEPRTALLVGAALLSVLAAARWVWRGKAGDTERKGGTPS